MKDWAAELRHVKATTLHLLEVLVERGIVSKQEVAGRLQVSSAKVRGLLGKPGKNNMQDTLEISQVATLLELFDSKITQAVRDEHPRINSLCKSLSDMRSAKKSNLAPVFDVKKFELNASKPKDKMLLALGHFLTFRRVPDSYDVLVSALHCYYDDDRGITVWENFHKLNQVKIPYRGVVSSQDGHFLFVGQRIDGLYINALSIKRPPMDMDFRLGIALVETDNIPTICRIFMKKMEVTALDDLEHLCGIHSVEKCKTKLGLRFEGDIDMAPYTDEDHRTIDNKKAIISRAY